MPHNDLFCLCTLPLAWPARAELNDPGDTEIAAHLRQALLVLNACNHLDAQREAELAAGEQRKLERLEAKLDLALHLLARALHPQRPPAPRALRLSPQGLSWETPAHESTHESTPEPGLAVWLQIHPCAALPLPLQLPGQIQAAEPGRIEARFTHLDEPLTEALVQYIFRRQREAIRAGQR